MTVKVAGSSSRSSSLRKNASSSALLYLRTLHRTLIRAALELGEERFEAVHPHVEAIAPVASHLRRVGLGEGPLELAPSLEEIRQWHALGTEGLRRPLQIWVICEPPRQVEEET